MESNPLVSVIIPCYNHEKYVADCLESVIAQTYKNIEIIICDDCSKDNSFEIVKNYEERLRKRFSSVIIYQNKINKGVVKNLNELIKKSHGKYIKEIASDDLLVPNAIEILVSIALNNKNIDVFHANAFYIYENTPYKSVFNEKFKKIHNKKFDYKKSNILYDLLTKNSILASTAFLPRETFEKYGLYDENFLFEDKEYWIRVCTKGGLFLYVNEVVTYYRMVDNSLSHININNFEDNKKLFKEEKKIISKYNSYINKDILAGFYNNQLSAMYNYNNKSMIAYIKNEMKKNRINTNAITKIKYFVSKIKNTK